MRLDNGNPFLRPWYNQDIDWTTSSVSGTFTNDGGTTRFISTAGALNRAMVTNRFGRVLVTTAGAAGEFGMVQFRLTRAGDITREIGAVVVDGSALGNAAVTNIFEPFLLMPGDAIRTRTITIGATAVYTFAASQEIGEYPA